jgi:hypothetical protein
VLFTDSAGMAFRQRWLDMIYRHCHFIAGHFSKYSSANNHLLGEHMGLFVGSLTWPLWRECDGWRDTALKGFESEALRQNTTDGVNREQAVWYHHEVADMMLICGLLGRANGKEFSDDYWTRLEAMLDFIVAIMDAGGNLPMIGDSDDAVMVRFSREADFSPYHSLLATGAVLFQRCDFKARAGHFDDKSRWLLGDLAKEQFAGLPQTQEPEPHRRAFPEGGYYVLGHAWQSASEIRIVADAGPLGYLSIAAHAHADALAFTLSAGGREFLIDPGTFAYHTHKKWRDYFRSTSAHNTVRVDGLDQSVGGGNFMWLQHASATVRAWEASDRRDRLVACHNGYLRLPDPVLHTREILLEKDTGEISVRDTLTCKHKHRIELFWHCHEDAKVWLTDSGVTVAREARRLEIAISDLRFVPRLARGEETPPLGWVSRCFDVKQATTTIVWSGEIEGVTSIESKLTLHFY